jgi:hypothetical protein
MKPPLMMEKAALAGGIYGRIKPLKLARVGAEYSATAKN